MTGEERLENLEQELERVKRRVRRLLQGVICLFAAGCVFAAILFTMGSATAQGEKVIRANQFILEDQKGKLRGGLHLLDGVPTLLLNDQNQKPRATLTVTNGGPSLSFFSQNDKPSAMLMVTNDGPSLIFFSQNDEPRAKLSVTNEGSSLALYDNEKVRAIVGSTQAHTTDGKTISYPESSLLLFSPEGKVIWEAP